METLKRDLLYVFILTLAFSGGYATLYFLEKNSGFLTNLGSRIHL
jgi:hypothetical protein